MPTINREKLKEIRKKKKLTQIQLSQMAGIGVASLIRYEKGEREPDMDTTIKLANALNIHASELIDNDLQKTLNLWAQQLPKSQLLEAFDNLTEEGQSKVIDYANDITPKYKK